MQYTSWPEVAYLAWQYVLNVLDFSAGVVIGFKVFTNSGQKLLSMPLFYRLSCRIPALIIDASNEQGQLRSEFGHFFDGEAVA
jgi:hypothetical protein